MNKVFYKIALGKMAEIAMTIPDYANLKKLPTGSTISLWDCRHILHNEDKVESTILMPKAMESMPWSEVLDNDKTYWFCAMTMPEYKSLLDNEGQINVLPGSFRKPGGWEQMIFLPTTEEAVQWLAYHQSVGHTMGDNETVVMAICFDHHNLCHNMAVKKASIFQRGYSVQVLQIHSPFNYKLVEQETNNIRILHMKYNAAMKFQKYKWSNGWIWLYGHTMHVETMIELADSSPHHTILRMALDHLGQYGQAQLPESVQLKLQQYKAANQIDTFFVSIPCRQQKGHEDHYNYIQKKTMDLNKEMTEAATQGTKRLRTEDKDETNEGD